MKSSAKKVELASVDDLFSTEESRADAQRERVMEIPLSERIAGALNQILSIYGVPENNRAEKIRRILALDYNDIRQRVREGSLRYVDQLNMASSDEREDV